MIFFNQFFLALRSYHKAFDFIDKNRLWKLFLLPSIITLIIALVIGYMAWVCSDDIVNYLIGIFEFRSFSEYWGKVIEFVFVMIIRGMALFFFIKIYRYFVLIFFAPVLAHISKKVYCIDSRIKYSINIGEYTGRISRGILVALQNLALEIPLTLLILLFSLIVTWLAPIGPFLMLGLESYFFGLAMIDYRNKCKGLSIRQSRQYSLNNPGLALGNGLYFNLLLLIPLLGVMMAPIVSLIAGGLAANTYDKSSISTNEINKSV